MNQDDYKVVVEDGKQFLYYKGEKLPNQIKSVVRQDMEHLENGKTFCTVQIEVLAMLVDTKPLTLDDSKQP